MSQPMLDPNAIKAAVQERYGSRITAGVVQTVDGKVTSCAITAWKRV